jgi:hypothetical protein
VAMPDNEHDYDLFWHALNYRGASSENAQLFWKELEACVERICERGLDNERFAQQESHW